jgi:hypothetical protein
MTFIASTIQRTKPTVPTSCGGMDGFGSGVVDDLAVLALGVPVKM